MAEQQNSGQKELLPVTYVCATKCYWSGRLWEVGDEFVAPPGTKVPEHFEQSQRSDK
jgi:hypothetical protein